MITVQEHQSPALQAKVALSKALENANISYKRDETEIRFFVGDRGVCSYMLHKKEFNRNICWWAEVTPDQDKLIRAYCIFAYCT